MSENRKKPGVAFWAIVVKALLAAYVVGFGPAIWFGGQSLSPWVSAAYWPLGRLAVHGPHLIRSPLARYASAFEFGTMLALRFDYDIDHEGPVGTLVPTGDGLWQIAE